MGFGFSLSGEVFEEEPAEERVERGVAARGEGAKRGALVGEGERLRRGEERLTSNWESVVDYNGLLSVLRSYRATERVLTRLVCSC